MCGPMGLLGMAAKNNGVNLPGASGKGALGMGLVGSAMGMMDRQKRKAAPGGTTPQPSTILGK